VSATALAVEAGMLHNFSWHLHWTWRERCAGITWQETLLRLLKYQASNGAVAMAVNLLAVRVLVGGLGLHYLVANLFATAAAGIINFAIAEFLIFRCPWIEAAAPASSRASSSIPRSASETVRLGLSPALSALVRRRVLNGLQKDGIAALLAALRHHRPHVLEALREFRVVHVLKWSLSTAGAHEVTDPGMS
jgi:hypothetical protein